MCVCYHLILEATKCCYPNKLSMDGMRFEKTEIQNFCFKNVILRRYVNFNSLVELHHLDLLTSTEKLQKQMMLFHFQTH